MAKEKLFTPEDFDKEPKAPKTNYMKWVITAIIVIIAIIALVLGLKSCESDKQSQKSESPQTTIATDNDSTTDSAVVVVSDSIDTRVSQKDETSSNEIEVNNENQPSMNSPEQVQHAIKGTDISSDIEDKALKVIRGDYGNNPDRESNLGKQYQLIQNRVNELKRQGVF